MNGNYIKAKNSYQSDAIELWVKRAKVQKVKDKILIKHLLPFFKNGQVLELGAGCGQLSILLGKAGKEQVIASDVHNFFIEYMLSQNLDAIPVDALDINKSTEHKFDSIFTQGLTPLITKDLTVVQQTYISIYKALKPGGRFIFIFPKPFFSSSFSSVNDHVELIENTGFRIVRKFRNQVFPSNVYNKINIRFAEALEMTLGKLLGIRVIFILEK